MFDRASKLEAKFEDALHTLRGEPLVTGLRTIGLACSIDLDRSTEAGRQRPTEVFRRAFAKGLLVRVTETGLSIAPPLTIDDDGIERIVETLRAVLREMPK